MGMTISGGQGQDNITTIEKEGSLVVKDVKVIHKEITVEVPKYVTKEQIKWVDKTQEQTRYETIERPTIKYNVKEQETLRYIPRDSETIRYIVKDENIERPVPVDTPYERPVIREKEYTIVTYKDVNAIKELKNSVFELKQEVDELKSYVGSLRNYKLVEEIVKVPKLKYVPQVIERIVWKDIPRERCSKCGREVD